MIKRNVISKLKQLKETGFSFENNDSIRYYLEIFGEDSLDRIPCIYKKSSKELAETIVAETGLVYFKNDQDEKNSAITSYKISDISTFCYYRNNLDNKSYIEFSMSNGTKVKKEANTAMADVLIDKFAKKSLALYQAIEPESYKDRESLRLDDFYKPKNK